MPVIFNTAPLTVAVQIAQRNNRKQKEGREREARERAERARAQARADMAELRRIEEKKQETC